MSSTRPDEVRLEDMLASCQRVRRYVSGVSFERFTADEMMQDATARRLEIIGEAASRVSPGFKAHHPGIPWQSAGSMRNQLVHDYANVSLAIVWETLCVSVPDLVFALEPLVSP